MRRRSFLLLLAGTFASSPGLRGLLWGLDGVALIIGTALLVIHHSRRGNELIAAGFLGVVAVILAVRIPRRAPAPRRADDDAALEEIDAD